MLHVLNDAIAVVTLAGLAYMLFACVRIVVFARWHMLPAESLPPVTVLKPIYGLEANLFENLCSFCAQDYPAYQILFCFREAEDPAIAVVHRVIEQYAHLDLAVSIGNERTASNPKIANLMPAFHLAKHDLIVIADADISVGSRYLRDIATAFSDAHVGAATCLYAGVARGGVSSGIGALHLNDHFAPSVLVAIALEPLRFCLGATMAVRRNVLDEIGGLAALAGHLGDDYVLGASVARRGYDVALVRHVVQTTVSEPGIAALVAHQLRWARTIRKQRPFGYAFLFITYPLPFAILYLILAQGTPLSLALLLVASVIRYALNAIAHATFTPGERKATWLIPLCDILDLVIWIAGCFGRNVDWRGRRFALLQAGRVESGISSPR